MADLGWLGVLVPEDAGGLGLGLVDLVVLQEELGRLPFPGPFLSSAVAATLAAVRLGEDDLVAGSGFRPFTRHGRGRRARPRRPARVGRAPPPPPQEARGHSTGPSPSSWTALMPDWALVVAREGDGLATFLLEEPAGELGAGARRHPQGRSRRARQKAARRVGPAGDQTAIWRRVLDDLAVAVCAELVGTCERALSLAVDYAKVRVQFDRPIATFQVIKHKAADMLHQLELARVGTHYAAWASDADHPERERAAAMAKGFVAEAANLVTAECIQIHGGVGFTWDVDCHLLYRRAKQDDLLFGAQGYQRERLAT